MTARRGRFTRKGRLVNRWTEALAEPDPARSVRQLLDVGAEFARHPGTFADLWPSFVDSVLHCAAARLLTPADLAGLETLGAEVAAGSGGGLSLEAAWFPLIAARDARREYDAANALLGRLYWSPDLAAPRKAAIARELARKGASAAEYQAVYVDYLSGDAHPAVEPGIVAVLARCLAVGFDLSAAQVERAGELAGKLRAAGVAVPGVELALGYAAMLADRDPARAARHLEAAYAADRSDLTALIGMLSAWVRGGEHRRVLALARDASRPAWRAIDDLALLSATLLWLDDSTVDGWAPAGAARLEALPVATYAGGWLGYAIGRLHLLEGDAAAAAAVLVPLAEAHPEQARWHYHAAWALLLLGDWLGVAQRFHAGQGWWAIGCLLAEANPNVVDTVELTLAEYELPPAQAQIVAARLTLGRRGRPRQVGVLAGGPPEERLESLRTALGTAYSLRNAAAMTDALRDPAFLRLPLADQLLWSGLALPPEHGRALLEFAADGLRYPRAGLVLTVRGFETGEVTAPDWLAGMSWRSDPTMELVRAWTEVLGDAWDMAAARLESLAEREEPAAHYALGNLWLRHAGAAGDGRAALVRAATEFRAELNREPPATLPDARILAHCTELVSDPEMSTTDSAAHWATLRDRPVPGWVGWTVALAALADDPANVDLRAGERLVTILEDTGAAPEATAVTVAFGLTRACLLAAEPDRTEALAALLERLAELAPGPDVVRLSELCAAAAARRRPSHRALAGVPGALVMAERALAGADRAAAAGHLRAAAPGDGIEARFCRLTADLLDDRPIGTDIDPPGEDSVAAQALRIVQAAAVVNDDPDRAMDLLGPAIQDRDLTGIVRLHRALPRLCAGAGRRRQVPEYVVRLVHDTRATGDGALDPPMLARCLVAIGERERALALWRQALPDHPEVRDEYAAALCHEAVLARREGADDRAAACLLWADRVLSGKPLSPTQGELVAPAKPRRSGMKTPTRKRDAPDAQTVLARAYASAVAGGDEPRALLCLALLEKPAARAGADLAGLARTIVSELCLGRLLDHLCPHDPEVRERPGRHTVIESCFEQHPNLLFALLDADPDAVEPEWRNCLTSYGSHVRFHHVLAVLYRERALDAADHKSTADNLVAATALWALLLSTEEFCEHLGERADEAQLRESVVRELLTAHETRGRQALAAGDTTLAARQLRCLADCGTQPATLTRVLDAFHIPYRSTVDPARFAEVAAIAGDVLRHWVSEVVRIAEAAVDDTEAIEQLPDGVRKNYPGGVEALQPFVRLGVPIPQVLTTGLEWFNEWRYGLFTIGELVAVKQLAKPAGAFADPLIPLCVKENSLAPENEALARHFVCLGLARDDLDESARHLRAALDWNPTNINARELLSDRLTEQAAELMAKTTPFIEAMQDIQRLVQRKLNNGAAGKPATTKRSTKDCAVCGKDDTRARRAVVDSIVETVLLTGSFRAQGLAFWDPFADKLCGSCGGDLTAIPKLKPVTARLLDEALTHDSTNETAKKLLEIARSAP